MWDVECGINFLQFFTLHGIFLCQGMFLLAIGQLIMAIDFRTCPCTVLLQNMEKISKKNSPSSS